MRTLPFSTLVLALCGCLFDAEEPTLCTLMGCSNNVRIHLDRPHERYSDLLPLRIDACVAETCRSWSIDDESCEPIGGGSAPKNCWHGLDGEGWVSFDFPAPSRAADLPVTVRVSAYAGRNLFEGEDTVKVSPYYPNGYECDKDHPCYSGGVEFALPSS